MKMIKPVLKYAAKSLKPGGRLFMEVDPITPDHIRSFINKYPDLKLHYENTYKDFANYDRIVEIVKATWKSNCFDYTFAVLLVYIF